MSPMIALPTGSCSARGRKCCGFTGCLDGFGIMNIHPFFHEVGIWGGLQSHHSMSFAKINGARNDACCRQTTPGVNGLAQALVPGMDASACSNWSTVKGTPGASEKVKSKLEGPAQTSCTNWFMIAALSTGLARSPAWFRSWICLRGCFGATLLIMANSWCVSCFAAATAAVWTMSSNCCCLICLACFLCKRFNLLNFMTWNHRWKIFCIVLNPGLSILRRCSHLFRMVDSAGCHAGGPRCVCPEGKYRWKVSMTSTCIWSMRMSASGAGAANSCAICCSVCVVNCCHVAVCSKNACLLLRRCCNVTLWILLCAKTGIQYLAMVQRMGACPTLFCNKKGESQRYCTLRAAPSASICLTHT